MQDGGSPGDGGSLVSHQQFEKDSRQSPQGQTSGVTVEKDATTLQYVSSSGPLTTNVVVGTAVVSELYLK